jgi:protein TonB
MKPKKTKKADLENFRTIFIQIGMILSLSAILFAFEWKSEVNIETLEIKDDGEVIEFNMPITRPELEKKVVKPMIPIEILVIKPNDVDIIDEPIFSPTEIGENDAIDISIYEEPEEVVEDPIYYNFQGYPKFMGKDDNAFRKYIIDNIKFPIDAQENGLSGKVQVQFVVDLDGSLSQIKILRGVNPSIDKEVMRVVGNSPKWEPAIQSGRYVRAMYGIIIAFELQ